MIVKSSIDSSSNGKTEPKTESKTEPKTESKTDNDNSENNDPDSINNSPDYIKPLVNDDLNPNIALVENTSPDERVDTSKRIINQEESTIEESTSTAIIEFEKEVTKDGQLLDNPKSKVQPNMKEVETEEENKGELENTSECNNPHSKSTIFAVVGGVIPLLLVIVGICFGTKKNSRKASSEKLFK